MVVRPLHVISLCTGGGGLDLAVELACPHARPILYVEREAFAVAALVEAMHEGRMAPAPVWSDVRTFRGRSWRGLVDLLIGGIPCQPHSLAGKREGADDERDLWTDARRIVAAVRPRAVLIENVTGMLTAKPGQIPGALRVRRDLSRMGYRVEAGIFSAEECEANHERQRVFILGLVQDEPERQPVQLRGTSGVVRSPQGSDEGEGNQREWDGRPAGNTGAPLLPGVGQADASSDGSPSRISGSLRPDEEGNAGFAVDRRHAVADAAGVVSNGRPSEPGRRSPGRAAFGRTGARGVEAAGLDLGVGHAEIEHGEGERQPEASDAETGGREPGGSGLPLFPPGPSDIAGWTRVLAQRPDLEPSVRRGADGLAYRVDQLFMLGNGVVPLAGAYAFSTLVHAHARAGVPFATQLVRMMAA